MKIINDDARNRILIKEQLKDAQVIIPLAHITGAPACNRDPIAAKTTNYDAIKTILDLRSKKQAIIYPSTLVSLVCKIRKIQYYLMPEYSQ